MNSAIVGVRPCRTKSHGKSETGVMYSRVKYSIRTVGCAGSSAVIIADPRPVDRIAHLNADRRGAEIGSALSHVHSSSGRRSEEWK